MSVQETDGGDIRLDGNAIGGLLREIFTMEMTTAETTCDGCGNVSVMGRVHVYLNAPGVVVRCPGCGHVLIRIVKGPGRYWVDLRGTRCLEFAPPGS
jgi:ribosomal protein S27E